MESEKATIRYEDCISNSEINKEHLSGKPKSFLLFPFINPFVNDYFFNTKYDS